MEEFHASSPAFGELTQADIRRTIETSFPMTILAGGELKVLRGLRMSWGRLYSNEITRLQSEDDSNHGDDCGADLAHRLANRNEEGLISVLHEMPTDGDLVGAGVSRPEHPDYDRWTPALSQLIANVLRLPNNPAAKSV